MIQIYGIKNCDTMKKAFKWLDESDIPYEFHDYKKGALNETLLGQWIDQLGWEALANKRGTTWRKLSEEEKSNMSDALAKKILLESPSIIKRPLIVKEDNIILGFKAEEYQEIFS